MRIIVAYLFLFSAGVGNFLWKQHENLQNILYLCKIFFSMEIVEHFNNKKI